MGKLLLIDNSLTIGIITIESDDGNLVSANFTALPGYDKYAKLFSEYENAANDQALVEVDRLEKIIAACGFLTTEIDGSHARSIRDLQIGSSRICFRWDAIDDRYR